MKEKPRCTETKNYKTTRRRLRATLGKALVCMFGLLPTLSLADLDARQRHLLNSKCVQCHANQHTGAPLIGAREEWRSVVNQGEFVTLSNVVQGIRGMPPLGYCSACSEEDLMAITRFMALWPKPATGQD